MTKNIKRIAHDLIPLSDAVTELSSLIFQLLSAVKPHATFDNPKASKYFDESAEACKKLAISSKLIREYVIKMDQEADQQGIVKD